ncbi:MAG: hypothetical protein PHC44_00745 [Lutispora sp.]|nr:hypothetical protein [Lutispora sp.]
MSTTLNFLAQEYVDLTVAKERHEKSTDVYWYTPQPYWKREDMSFSRDEKTLMEPLMDVKSEGRTLNDILDESDFLISCLELYKNKAKLEEMDRVNYLIDHAISLKTRALILLGENISYDDMTDKFYNLVAPIFDYSKFDEILKELDDTLPGTGPLSDRIIDFKRKILVPRDKLPRTLTAVTQEFHNFAVKNMDISKYNMPRLGFKNLNGLPFLTIFYGYCYDRFEYFRYLGLDYPYTVDKMVEVIGHEMEPGHLTYFEMRMKTFIDTSYPEMSIIAQHAPSSAFSEGSARRSVYMCFDNSMDKLIEFERDVIFDLGGLDKGLCKCMDVWHRFMDISNYGKLEVERNLWDGVWSKTDASKFMEKYLIADPGKGSEMVNHLPEDDGHFVCHDYGRDIVGEYFSSAAENTDKQWKLYQKLCKSHMSMKGIKDKTYKVSLSGDDDFLIV